MRSDNEMQPTRPVDVTAGGTNHGESLGRRRQRQRDRNVPSLQFAEAEVLTRLEIEVCSQPCTHVRCGQLIANDVLIGYGSRNLPAVAQNELLLHSGVDDDATR